MNLTANRPSKKLITFLSGLLLSIAVSFGASPTSVVTVQIVGNGTVNPNYDGQALTNGNKYSMTAKPRTGFKFTGWTGSATSSKTKLTFTNAPGSSFTATFVDQEKPKLTITPVPGSKELTNGSFYVSGTAKDNDAVAYVLYRLNGEDWQEATSLNNWANWYATVNLDAGTNTLEAVAVDASDLASKTNKLKLIYSVAPTSLAGYTISAVNSDSSVVTFNFNAAGFTEVTGVGTYTYKKTSSTVGRITPTYTAPPSATASSNNTAIVLRFTSSTGGTFNDGANPFTIAPANGWAPPTLNDSSIVLNYDDDNLNQTQLRFPSEPLVLTNASNVIPNPFLVPLDDFYPGQYGDRVKVLFSRLHFVSQNNAWVQYPSLEYIGTIIEIGDTAVTVLFDAPPKNDKANQYSLVGGVPLDILTCTVNSTLLTNSTSTFSFTNTSPDGALLKLSQDQSTQYLVMNFTSDSDTGTFYEEDYAPGNSPVSRSGNFSIALAPQIVTSPSSVFTTNGGTASFTVKTSGTPPLSYQWQLNGTNLAEGLTGSGSTITGSATTNLTISSVALGDLGSYRVVVSNLLGQAISGAATLGFALAPQITSQPANSFPTNGGTATFNVAATGSLPLAYRWQMNGTNLNNGTTLWNSVIAGSTTTNLTISAVSTNDIGFYQVVITNVFGSVTSSPPAVLTLSQ